MMWDLLFWASNSCGKSAKLNLCSTGGSVSYPRECLLFFCQLSEFVIYQVAQLEWITESTILDTIDGYVNKIF